MTIGTVATRWTRRSAIARCALALLAGLSAGAQAQVLPDPTRPALGFGANGAAVGPMHAAPVNIEYPDRVADQVQRAEMLRTQIEFSVESQVGCVCGACIHSIAV